MKRALVIRHHVEDDIGLVGEAFRSRGFDLVTEMLDGGHRTPTLEGYDCLIVLGANFSVYEPAARAAFVDRELALLLEADRRDLPVLGICFGAQLLCTAFGGVVEKAPEGETGWMRIDVAPQRTIPDGPWFEYHEDRCLLPESADVWASTDRAVQVFAIGRHLGVQFHPEIDEVQLAGWFASMSEEPRAHTDHEAALLDETARETPASRTRVATLVDTFLQHAALDAAVR